MTTTTLVNGALPTAITKSCTIGIDIGNEFIKCVDVCALPIALGVPRQTAQQYARKLDRLLRLFVFARSFVLSAILSLARWLACQLVRLLLARTIIRELLPIGSLPSLSDFKF